jgi:hypothetical protein
VATRQNIIYETHATASTVPGCHPSDRIIWG